ncbi:hypothetical protein [Allokutzneria oryzae]|uniref:Secreted protein n=1 Tax=Allokutzneria oryzae TaxID=1378989 RepID=A0ABV6A8F8_9PSEU
MRRERALAAAPVVFTVLVVLLLAAVPFAGPAPCPVSVAAAKAAGTQFSGHPQPECSIGDARPQVSATVAAPNWEKAVPLLVDDRIPPSSTPAIRPQPRGTPHSVDLLVLSVLRI